MKQKRSVSCPLYGLLGLGYLTVWYNCAALIFLLVSYSGMSQAYATVRRPPSEESLRQSLLRTAHKELKFLLDPFNKTGRTILLNDDGLYEVWAEPIILDITDPLIQHEADGSITGSVATPTVWKRVESGPFHTRQEAEDAKPTREERMKVRTTFVWTRGRWRFKEAKGEAESNVPADPFPMGRYNGRIRM